MYWHFDGEMMVHPTDGTEKNFEVISADFWLPDSNVRVIRAFVESQKDFILAHKYQSYSGSSPWGDTYPEMMTRLNELQPPGDYLVGVTDKQTQVALIAYRHELINNVDSYFVHPDRRGELAAA
jgi:hypothetical protein